MADGEIKLPGLNHKSMSATRSSNLSLMRSSFPRSFGNLSSDHPNQDKVVDSASDGSDGESSLEGFDLSGKSHFIPVTKRNVSLKSPRSSPGRGGRMVDESPVCTKRRRMNQDEWSSMESSLTSSPSDSPINLTMNYSLDSTFDEPLNNRNASPISIDSELASLQNFDAFGKPERIYFENKLEGRIGKPLPNPQVIYKDGEFSDGSIRSPGLLSPFLQRRHSVKEEQRYRKERKALWNAIQSDYHYLMDKEIIETCKSTESDLSWESDDLMTNTKVSFTEFLQQYKELNDWLSHIKEVTQRRSSSLSEKYLNQKYHEEMLECSPRRKLFNDYAKTLMRRYPSMRDEISRRLEALNGLWEALLKVIGSHQGQLDQENMIQDLELDLKGLHAWLHGIEGDLNCLMLKSDWSMKDLECKLEEHQTLQSDIESHSRIVTSVVRLCEVIQNSQVKESEALQQEATQLERRWHTVWLQSLEWGCRLEDAIKTRNQRPALPFPKESEDWIGCSSVETQTGGDKLEAFTKTKVSTDEETAAESDFSCNYDVIPFSESEYEKIDVQDTDGLTPFSSSASLSPASSGKEEGETDRGLDSALGRSVSDEYSINESRRCLTPGNQTNVEGTGKSTTKAVTFARELCQEMKLLPHPALDGEHNEDSNTVMMKSDCPDVGYSSESHSNDEPDSPQHRARTNHSGAAANLKGNLHLDEAVLRHKVVDSGCSQDVTPSPSGADKSWRHSMTSAYDTSSNCSDLNSPYDLDGTLDCTDTSICTAIEQDDFTDRPASSASNAELRQKVADIMSTSSQDFYALTMVDTDIESNPNLRSGANTDVEYDGMLAEHQDVAPTHSTPVKDELNDLETSFSFENQDPSHQTPAKREIFSVEEILPTLDNNSPSSNKEKVRSQALLTEAASPNSLTSPDNSPALSHTADHLQPSTLPSPPCMSSTPCHQEPTDCRNEDIRKLIDQAELLVKDTQLSVSKSRKRRQRGKRRRRYVAASDVLTTDASVTASENVSSAPSSCDASSEGTTCSDSDSEYSTAASEADENYRTSTTLTNRSLSSQLGQSDAFSHETLMSSLTNSPVKKRNRLVSIAELREISNRLDSAPFTQSESAIDHIKKRHQQNQLRFTDYSASNLRRTVSETMTSSNQRVKRQRKRRARRSVRDKEELYPSVHHRSVQRKENRLRHSPEKGRFSHLDTSESEIDHKGIYALDSDCEEGFKGMNSTGESFSENAWDNYQDHYPTASDDPSEEKLDDSSLLWEQNLDFEEDFQFDTGFGADLMKKPRGHQREKKLSTSALEASRLDDSDSDLEDLHYVFEESRKQMRVVESKLKHRRKDPLNTGIYLDPSNYGEIIAMCATNIRCIQEVNETLDQSEGVNVTLDDLQQTQSIIQDWEVLHALAQQRHLQSRELSAIYKDFLSTKSSLQEFVDELETSCYDNELQLEHAIKKLQERRGEIYQYRDNISLLIKAAKSFSECNPCIDMNTLRRELVTLEDTAANLGQKTAQRLSQLQPALISWYNYNDTLKELSYLLDSEGRQLECLEVTQDTVTFTKEDIQRTIKDLKDAKQEFDMYGRKLESMRQRTKDILPVCNDKLQMQIRSNLALLDSRLSGMQTKCSEMLKAMQDLDVRLQPGMNAAAARVEWERMNTGQTRVSSTGTMTEPVETNTRQPLLMRILRTALPIQVALVMLLGLAYFVDPENGLSFTPELRYVRGPPPI